MVILDMSTVTIIGAGAMGSALTVPLIHNGHRVNLWGTELDGKIIKNLREGKEHPKHKCKLPDGINAYYVDELEKALKDTDLIIMAITSDAIKKIFKRIIPYINGKTIVGSVSKGLEFNKNKRIVILPEVLKESLPEKLKDEVDFVVVGGPCKAIEVIFQSPTSVVYSSQNIESAKYMQSLLMTDAYRVNVNKDVVGTEICAAMKNAYSVGLGIAEGFENINGHVHNNTKSALFTFALKEMIKLTDSMGGKIKSAIGLSGTGDLEVTGEAGRNRMFGKLIGGGYTPSQAVEKMRNENITVEGYSAIKFGYDLVIQLEENKKLSLSDMKFLNNLYEIVYENKPAYELIKKILHDYSN